MARLLDILAATLSLDNTGLSDSGKLNECRHKLEHTYVLVDGECTYLPSIGELVIMQDRYGNMTEPFSMRNYDCQISLINIDSGVYLFNNDPHLVMRRAKKMYKKSWYPDAYNISDLSENGSSHFDYFMIHSIPKQSIYRNGNGIYYWNYKIGVVIGPKKVKILNKMFEQEITEALNNGTIKI